VMLIFLAVLISLNVYKYKVFGFTFHMLNALESVVIAVFIGSILLIRVNHLLNDNSGNTDPQVIKV
jgi:hypothetical protein